MKVTSGRASRGLTRAVGGYFHLKAVLKASYVGTGGEVEEEVEAEIMPPLSVYAFKSCVRSLGCRRTERGEGGSALILSSDKGENVAVPPPPPPLSLCLAPVNIGKGLPLARSLPITQRLLARFTCPTLYRATSSSSGGVGGGIGRRGKPNARANCFMAREHPYTASLILRTPSFLLRNPRIFYSRRDLSRIKPTEGSRTFHPWFIIIWNKFSDDSGIAQEKGEQGEQSREPPVRYQGVKDERINVIRHR